MFLKCVSTTDHGVTGSIPGITTILIWIGSGTGSIQLRENIWVAT